MSTQAKQYKIFVTQTDIALKVCIPPAAVLTCSSYKGRERSHAANRDRLTSTRSSYSRSYLSLSKSRRTRLCLLSLSFWVSPYTEPPKQRRTFRGFRRMEWISTHLLLECYCKVVEELYYYLLALNIVNTVTNSCATFIRRHAVRHIDFTNDGNIWNITSKLIN